MKIVSPLTLVCALLSCSLSHRSYSQDLALHKKYTYSSAPNYSLTSPDPNHTLLTDGNYTSDSKFWISKTTVGWQYPKKLTIEIDLQQSSSVSTVAFNTVRGGSGVEFPQNVFVFTSVDQKSYAYIGDAAADPDNTHGDYEVKKFTLSNINRTARYIKLVVIPKGAFVFCDEIEVGAGNNSNNDGAGTLTANTDKIVDSLVKNRTHLQTIAYRIKNLAALSGDNSNNTSPEDMAASLDEQALNAKLSKAREQWAANLRSKFSSQFVVEKVSPWQTVKSSYQPKESSDNTYNIAVPINGVEYGGFMITNLQSSKQTFTCQFSGAGDVSDPELFTIPFVTSGVAHNEIADPLIPVAGSIDLEPGESRMCVFKISGKKAGQANGALKIQSGTSSVNLSLNINVINLSFGSTFSLNANAWAYLNYPLVADRKDEAIADLHTHHINTMVVPPNVLPVVGSNDFSKFNSYIAEIKSFKNICLFMNLASGSYKNSFKTTPFLSDQWKANFLTWYGQIVQGAQAAGISASQLYVYPYDEVRGSYVRNSADFLTWLRQTHPEIKTFGTLVDQTGSDKILPLLTISTLLRTMNNAEDVASANAGTHDLWLYETNGNSEALSAYAYYRLIAWEAFVYGFQGVGFWDYADSTGKLELDAYDGVSSVNYSVIYHGPGKEILSSRRWEAFKLGIEDYELLKKYAAKAGLDNAKSLAKSVLDNPNDANMAEQAREQLLKALGQ